jgi:hypothetical protein
MLFVTDAQIESARTDLKYPRHEIRDRLVEVCRRRRLTATPESLLSLSPQRNHFIWDAFLGELSLAHVVTDEEHYLDHAMQFVRQLPERWRDVPRDADLFVPFVLATLARFYDLERDRLSEEDTAAIRSMMADMTEWLWGELPVRDYGERERAAWNHSIIAFSSLAVAGLVLDDHPAARSWLDLGLERTRLFFEVGVSKAGLTYEGLHYCGYVFKTIGLLLNGLRNTGRIAELAPEGSEIDAKLHRIPAWYAHEMWPAGRWLQNYNDSHWNPASPLYGFLIAFAHYEPELCSVVWNRLVGRNALGSWGWHQRWSSLADSLLFFPDSLPTRATLRRLDDHLFCPEVGYLSARDSWDDDASVFTFNAGRTPCELHDQADNNSFTFIAGGKPVVIDSGASNRLSEVSASSARGHNLVFIDGRGQHPAGQGTCVDGRVLDVERTEDYVAVIGEATDSYAAGKYNSAGRYMTDRYNPVRHALRHAIFVKHPYPYLVVYDDIQKDRGAHDYEYLLHVPWAETANPSEPSSSFTVSTDAESPTGRITFLEPTSVTSASEPFVSKTAPYADHVLLRFGTRAVNPQFVVLYVPAARADIEVRSEVEHRRDRVTVRLHWPHGTDEIVFSSMARGRRPDELALPSLTSERRAVAGSRNGRTPEDAESGPLPPLPTFLIIGAQKSATRWLRVNLGKHPDVYTASREIMYFSNPVLVDEEGPSWYRAQFDGWSGEPIIGEATPSYMAWPRHPHRVAARIKQLLPDVRLIAILRNPIDRAYSAMVHHMREGRLPADSDLVEIVARISPHKDRWGLIGSSRYAANLAPYQRHFGDQLLVLLHDDLCDDPRRVFDQSLRHIGAAPGFIPPSLEAIVHSQQQADPLGGSKPGLRPRQRRQLFEVFRDDIRQLETMIDRDLSIWQPDRSSAQPKSR